MSVRRHYHRMNSQIACQTPLQLESFLPPLVVVPIDRWTKIANHAFSFALTISTDVRGLHIDSGERTVYLRECWTHYVEEPSLRLGVLPPKLIVIYSPYRFIVNPIVDYVLDLARKNPDRQIAVLIPELVERHWYYHVLHNHRGAALKALLYFKGSRQIIVINMPWYIYDGKT
jgi:hypothetical protein